MIKVGIIGSTGYAGVELVRLIQQHKEAEVVWFGSRSYVEKKYSDVFGNMFQIIDAKCLDDNMEQLAEAVDVIFTATPQGLCSSLVTEDMWQPMKNGMELRIKARSLLMKLSMVCVKLTEIRSGMPELLPIRDAIQPVVFYPFTQW